MLEIIPLPVFSDNYIWLLRSQNKVIVVDPGDAQPVMKYLEEHHDTTLVAVLITHHHADHCGGVGILKAHHPAPVFGPMADGIPGIDHDCRDDAVFSVDGFAQPFRVLAVPGHTLGHIAFLTGDILFCGDALFSGGCGRLFEGSAQQMHASLQRLAALPTDTRICCAHEYTQTNLAFARLVEPDNTSLAEYQMQVAAWRKADKPSLPARMETERAVNPFLRCHLASVASAAAKRLGRPATGEVEVFSAIRAWRNQF